VRVYESLANQLTERGVRCAFSLPSGEIMPILLELERRGIKLYRTRHEHAAIGMADGYARVSGQLGVVLVGRGPGLTNGINALVTARKAGSPVLLIAGEAFSLKSADPELAAGYGVSKKGIDQSQLLSALGIPTVTLDSPASAVADFAAAAEFARVDGAAAVLVPQDVVRLEAGNDGPRVDLPTRRSAEPAGASPESIADVADLLETPWASSRPVILAGRGTVRAGARTELLRIGEAVGALYATTLLGKGLFGDDPWAVGIAGTMSSPGASELLSRSDLVLVFGSSLNPFTTMAGDLFRHARVIRIDHDAAVLRSATGEVVPIIGDVKSVASQLAAELTRRGVRRAGYRTDYARDLIDADRAPARDAEAADAKALLSEIDRLLPQPRTLIVDPGAHIALSGRYLSASEPASFWVPSEYSSVGAGQPIALGACLARPDRSTVHVFGDGGFMMTLGDLDTAVRYRLPLTVLVMNNGGFAAEYENLRLDGQPVDLTLYDNPDFAAVARALGADGVTVAGPADLVGLRERLAAQSGPLVVDVKLPIDAENDWVGVSHRMHTAVSA
jgi:thiamine pyrophosphate-dependent acetolactate synthase large subunit-like protein